LLPKAVESLGVIPFYELEAGIEGVDVIIMLRLQKERMQGAFIPSEHEYYQCFGLTQARLARAKEDCLVLHPGPINRGVEIASEVADGGNSVILEQVGHGIAIRMAVMALVMGGV